MKQSSGAARIALVGNSRGGNAIRNFIKNGGGGDIGHAMLCGTPITAHLRVGRRPGNEFNGRGLRGLNDGDSEVTAGTAFLTLRSDGPINMRKPMAASSASRAHRPTSRRKVRH